MFSQESPNVIQRCGNYALSYALEMEMSDVVDQIFNYNSDMSFWVLEHPTYDASYRHPVKLCVEISNVNSLHLLLKKKADPNMGLLQSWKLFSQMPMERQLKNHLRYRFGSSPLNTAVTGHSGNTATERHTKLYIINLLLYYGASPSIAGVFYTPLHALLENFGSMVEDITVTVKLMVMCGIDLRYEQWLIDRLHPGVPLGCPPLRQWLMQNVRNPMPLFNRCIVSLRSYLGPFTFEKAFQLPLPKPLIQNILLHHIFDPSEEEA